jgi:hypothetical protein
MAFVDDVRRIAGREQIIRRGYYVSGLSGGVVRGLLVSDNYIKLFEKKRNSLLADFYKLAPAASFFGGDRSAFASRFGQYWNFHPFFPNVAGGRSLWKLYRGVRFVPFVSVSGAPIDFNWRLHDAELAELYRLCGPAARRARDLSPLHGVPGNLAPSPLRSPARRVTGAGELLGFFYNVFLLRFVKNTYFSSFLYCCEWLAAYAARSSVPPFGGAVSWAPLSGARGNSISPRLVCSPGFLLAAAESISGAVYRGRRSSPFVSVRHFLWASLIAGPHNSRFTWNYAYPQAMLSFLKTNLFSKKMFWNAGLRQRSTNFEDWHLKYFLRGAYMVKHNRRFLKAGYSTELLSRGFKQFKRIRSGRQAARHVLLSGENEFFWSLYAADRRAAFFVTGLWEHRAKKIVDRPFLSFLDPFSTRDEELGGGGDVLSPFSHYGAEPVKARALSRAFAGAFFTHLAKKIEESFESIRPPLNVYRAARFYRELGLLLREFLNGSFAKYHDFTQDFSLSLRVLASRKRFYLTDDEKSSGCFRFGVKPGFADSQISIYGAGDFPGANAAAPEKLRIDAWFARYWGDGLALDRPFRFFLDRRSIKLSGDLDFISRRYLVASDLERTNFSSYCSSNKSAFSKLLTSLLNVDSFGRFRITPFAAAGVISAAAGMAVSTELARLARKGDYFLPGASRLSIRRAAFGALACAGMRRFRRRPKAVFSFRDIVFFARESGAWRPGFNSAGRSTDALFSVISGFGVTAARAIARLSHSRLPTRDLRRLAYKDFSKKSAAHAVFLRSFVGHVGGLPTLRSRFVSLNAISRHRPSARLTGPLVGGRGCAERGGRIPFGRFGKHFSNFMYRHVLVRRIREMLRSGAYGASAASFRADVSALLPKMYREYQRRQLFKHNPDIAGRSRVFYFVQKKTRYARKWNKRYRALRFHLPFMNLTTKRLSGHIKNKYMIDQHVHRVDAGKKFFKLKFYLRHALRREFDCSSTTLFLKWRAIKETKNKWLAYFMRMEGGLANYVWLCRMVRTRALARRYVEAGLFRVNTEICVNPEYRAIPGDVITMSSRAYWEISARRLAKYFKKLSAPSDAPNNAKRELLQHLLGVLRKKAAGGVTSAVSKSTEREMVERASSLFVGEANLKWAPRKPTRAAAPGGISINTYDVYNSGLTRFAVGPSAPRDVAFSRKLVSKFLRKWDTSSVYDGAFFYRVNNVLYVVRHPASAKELFSSSKRRMGDLYNPWSIKTFYNHFFWR